MKGNLYLVLEHTVAAFQPQADKRDLLLELSTERPEMQVKFFSSSSTKWNMNPRHLCQKVIRSLMPVERLQGSSAREAAVDFSSSSYWSLHCNALLWCLVLLCFDVMVKLKGIWFEWWGGCADAGGLANLRQVNLFYRRLLLTLSSPSIITKASDSFASRSRGRGKSSLLMAKEGRKDTLFGFQWAGLRLTIMHTGNLENKL